MHTGNECKRDRERENAKKLVHNQLISQGFVCKVCKVECKDVMNLNDESNLNILKR